MLAPLPGRVRLLCCALLVSVLAGALLSGPADAASSRKKAIWGPVRVEGRSQFPIYADLGAGIFQMQLRWSQVARSRPPRPKDPADPAYAWPEEIDFALSEAKRYGMRVAVQIIGTPSWANGGRDRRWAPTRLADLGYFARAASRRYPGVRMWMIWGEPSRAANFMPLEAEQRTPEKRRPARMNREQRRAPRLYARMLDGAYVELKRESRRNLVIGGMTFTAGDISPYNFIRYMRLPNGRAPRMDLYGHNPFTARRPSLRKPPLGYGFADFSDLDTLTRWLDRYLEQPRGRRLRIFISELFWPTDHPNYEFNFYLRQKTAAKWLGDALRITRRYSRIYTLGYLSLYDDRPLPAGDEVNRGLLDYRGAKKPAYYAFKRG
ncbi:MAG: hypothetical protein ACR2NH_10595 [Solirubrobacteraceae bacterium]